MSWRDVSDTGVKGGKTQNRPWQQRKVITTTHTHKHTQTHAHIYTHQKPLFLACVSLFLLLGHCSPITALWKLHKERDPSQKLLLVSPALSSHSWVNRGQEEWNDCARSPRELAAQLGCRSDLIQIQVLLPHVSAFPSAWRCVSGSHH